MDSLESAFLFTGSAPNAKIRINDGEICALGVFGNLRVGVFGDSCRAWVVVIIPQGLSDEGGVALGTDQCRAGNAPLVRDRVITLWASASPGRGGIQPFFEEPVLSVSAISIHIGNL